jgi:hypothetical protein
MEKCKKLHCPGAAACPFEGELIATKAHLVDLRNLINSLLPAYLEHTNPNKEGEKK